jgi:YegS/Rv2252/BmrU family lipid kinase
VQGVLFLNQRAGSFSAADESDLRAKASELGLQVVDVVRSTNTRQIVQSALAEGVKNFVVAGGDGSIHHVLQALVGTEGILGVLPAGTVNHLARDLGLPTDWRQALDVAVRGSISQIDTGRVNDLYFVNSLMLGVYPTISEYRERFRRTHSKWRAYVKATRLATRSLDSVNLVLEIDGRLEAIRTNFFAVAVNWYDLSRAGLVAPKASVNDGRLTVYTLHLENRLAFIRAAARFFRGRIAETEGFRSIRAAELRVDSVHRRLKVAIDGEPVTLKTPLQIAAVPSSLLVRVSAGTLT